MNDVVPNVCTCSPYLLLVRQCPGHPDDIYYNAVGSLGEERGDGTGTGSGESMESKLEQLPSITSVEVCALHIKTISR